MNMNEYEIHIKILDDYANDRRSIFPRNSAAALVELIAKLSPQTEFNEASLEADRKIKKLAETYNLDYSEALDRLVAEGEVFL